MKLSKKGFTLIELLAAMVILAAIMIIAVPNVMGILNNSRADTYVEDAKKLLSLAEYEFRGTTTIERPAKGSCIAMSLQYLDNSNLDNAPNGGSYNKTMSYVIIRNTAAAAEKNQYEYFVTLVEDMKGGETRGVPLKSYSDLYSEDASDIVVNGTSGTFNDVSASGCTVIG